MPQSEWMDRGETMPDKKTVNKARELKKEGKSPSTQAGEFIREEIDKIRQGEHGARSTEQAIAIGLSEARRAGVDLPAPKKKGESGRKAIDHPKQGHGESASKGRQGCRFRGIAFKACQGGCRKPNGRRALNICKEGGRNEREESDLVQC
jgi:hypothetical protein